MARTEPIENAGGIEPHTIATVPTSSPHSRAEARGCRRVAGDVLGAADRLTVRMAEMPSLSGLDEASDEFTVDKLGAFTGGTSSTAHPALATTGTSRLRGPRCSGRVYFASSRFRPSHMHRGEQKR